MKSLKAALFISLSLALAPSVRATLVRPALARVQQEALRAAPEGQRSGALSDAEREVLRAAQQAAAPELLELRGGEISDHDMKVVGFTLLVIVALVIII